MYVVLLERAIGVLHLCTAEGEQTRWAVRESVSVDISGGKVLGLCIAGMLTYGIFTWYAQYLVMQATNDLAINYNSKYVYSKSVVDGTEPED